MKIALLFKAGQLLVGLYTISLINNINDGSALLTSYYFIAYISIPAFFCCQISKNK